MTLKRLYHIYLGSSFCGPFEAFTKLRTKNILFKPEFRAARLKNRIAARRIDLLLEDECRRISPILLEMARNRAKDPRAGSSTEFDKMLQAGVAALDGHVLDTIYPFITALTIMRAADGGNVASDLEIKQFLDAAEAIVSQIELKEVRAFAEDRHKKFVRRIGANGSFGYYCLFSIAHNNAENYPLKVLNDVISDHINTVILSLDIAEQKDLFSVLNYSAEEIAVQYLYKAMQISKDTAGDLLKVGVLESLEQFAAFVSKGREFGVFSGWDETNRNAARRDVCPNLENPIVRKVLEECGAKLPSTVLKN